MSLISLFTRRTGLRRQHQPYRFRPQLEVFESRALLSTLTVTKTSDPSPLEILRVLSVRLH
jgi:hypothetical protein